MESHVKVLGHPLHPILVSFPIGLFGTAFVFDLLRIFTNDSTWALVSFYLLGAGIVFGMVAAVAGWLDWAHITPGTRAKRLGVIHAGINIVVMALVAASWLLRRETPGDPGTAAFLLSFAAIGLAGVSGWLGGELVYRLRIGVDDGAHPNAPSSLSDESLVAPR